MSSGRSKSNSWDQDADSRVSIFPFFFSQNLIFSQGKSFVVVRVSRYGEGIGSNFDAVFTFFLMCIIVPAGGTDHSKKRIFKLIRYFRWFFKINSRTFRTQICLVVILVF